MLGYQCFVAILLLTIVHQSLGAALDEECTDTSNCTVSNTVCNTTSSKCACNTSYTQDDKVCKANAGTDCSSTSCITNADCPSIGNKVCVCDVGYSGTTCQVISTKKVGDGCSTNTDCITNAECTNPWVGCPKGSCSCKSGYTGSKGDTKCLANYQTTCSSDADCVTNVDLKCDGGKCVCNTNTYNTKLGVCTDKIAVGDDCSTNAGGCTDNAACPGTAPKVCTCNAGFTADSNKCRRPYLGEDCNMSHGCAVAPALDDVERSSSSNPTCINESCSCQSGYTEVSIILSGKSYKSCQNEPATLKDHQQTCADAQECTSDVCVQCPVVSGNVCVRPVLVGNTGSTMTASVLVQLAGIVAYSRM